jgi:hypothetical protein
MLSGFHHRCIRCGASLLNTRLPGRNYAKSLSKLFSVGPTLYHNTFLFWSCVAGFVIIFPLSYIPGLNLKVFGHLPITWEWSVVFACVVVQVLIAEAWKWVKRGKLGKLLAVKQPGSLVPNQRHTSRCFNMLGLGTWKTSIKIIHVRSAGRHSILKIEIAIELYIHIYL